MGVSVHRWGRCTYLLTSICFTHVFSSLARPSTPFVQQCLPAEGAGALVLFPPTYFLRPRVLVSAGVSVRRLDWCTGISTFLKMVLSLRYLRIILRVIRSEEEQEWIMNARVTAISLNAQMCFAACLSWHTHR
jgi:hypothetical protein